MRWALLIVISMLLLHSHAVDAKPWRGIEPLHSTRGNVENLLGSKVVRCGDSACIYDLGEEVVFILYTTDSSCKNDGATTAWKVQVGTVIEINVHFKQDKPLSQLGLDLSKFEKIEDEHLPGWIYYVNLEEGVRVEGGLRTASSMTYFQSAKDKYLRCPSVNGAKPGAVERLIAISMTQEQLPAMGDLFLGKRAGDTDDRGQLLRIADMISPNGENPQNDLWHP